MKTSINEIRGFDSVAANKDARGGVAETDAISAINSKKGLKSDIKKNADAVPPEQLPPTPRAVQGSDSVEADTPAPVTPPVDDGRLYVTADEISTIVAAGIAREMQPHQQKLASLQDAISEKDEQLQKVKDDAEAERNRLLSKVEAEKQHRDSLSKVFRNFGYAVPDADGSSPVTAYIAPSNLRGTSVSGKDAVREFNRILEDRDATPTHRVASRDTGKFYIHQDTRLLRKFMRDNRDAVRSGMEEIARKAGFLQGSNTVIGRDAPTTVANVPPAFLQYLSEVMRMEHEARFILWQFANRAVAAGIPPGQTSLVPRVRHLEAGTTSADWQLTPGTPLTPDKQPINASSVAISIRENGMGKTSTIRPVAIPDFILAYSLIDLENVMNQRLGYNYQLFEDIAIFEMLISTTSVVYNSAGDVTSTAANVTAGGQLTVDFLGSLYAHMNTLQIPTYKDGCYALATHPNGVAQLNKDLRLQQQYISADNTEELTNMMFTSTGNEVGRVSGYVGKVAGFHIFQGNSFSTGAAATPGVQSETIGGSARITRSCFAMGADTIGWATAMGMQIFESDDTDFGRTRSFVWRSHEGWNGLDIDPNRGTPGATDEQLRVLEVRLSDTRI